MANVILTEQAQREFDDLGRTIHIRVPDILEHLEKWPNFSGAKPLRGRLAGRFRIRAGDYRVQFRVESDRVVVEKIGHRDGFYED
jgi:mRNA-degrading endonuclease RelE of RelBE toxin-antitoxin system